jgi:hypothetical protein
MCQINIHKFILVLGFLCFTSVIMSGCVSNKMEERIAKLEESDKILQLEVTRAKDVSAIQAVMGRYETIHNALDIHKSWELFADMPDTYTQIAGGPKIEGYENVVKSWQSQRSGSNPGSPDNGTMLEHPLSSPIIVVAGDGQTAKATFVSLGHETHYNTQTKKYEPEWAYGKYAVDFIKQNGEWKIWHHRWFRFFRTSFYTAWSDQPLSKIHRLDANGKPILTEGVYFHPYTTDTAVESIPAAPKPYQTWTKEEVDWMYRANEHP